MLLKKFLKPAKYYILLKRIENINLNKNANCIHKSTRAVHDKYLG